MKLEGLNWRARFIPTTEEEILFLKSIFLPHVNNRKAHDEFDQLTSAKNPHWNSRENWLKVYLDEAENVTAYFTLKNIQVEGKADIPISDS